MTDTAEQQDGNFAVVELGYSDSLSSGPKYARSRQGMLFLRLTSGGAFNWINLRIVSSRIPLTLKYKCLYKEPGTEIALRQKLQMANSARKETRVTSRGSQ